jgi:hypothetical protein
MLSRNTAHFEGNGQHVRIRCAVSQVRCSYGRHMTRVCRREIVLPSELMNQHALLNKQTYAISNGALRGDHCVSEMSITRELRFSTDVTREFGGKWKRNEEIIRNIIIVEIHDRHSF